MKVIFSYWKTNEHFFVTEKYAYIANKLAQKHGYHTVLFTDEYGKEELKNIPYNEVIPFDNNILETFPKPGWSLAKILAMSLMNEPFMHMDFDLFLLKDLEKDFLQNEIFCFHKEQWLTKPQHHKTEDGKYFKNSIINPYSFEFLDKVAKLLDMTEDRFSIKFFKELNSYNCAIVGGQNFNIFKQSAKYVIDFAQKYKDVLEKFAIDNEMKVDWFAAVFLEQVVFLNLLKLGLGLEDIPIYLKANTTDDLNIEAQEKNVIHLWGSKEKLQFFVDELVKTFNLN